MQALVQRMGGGTSSRMGGTSSKWKIHQVKYLGIGGFGTIRVWDTKTGEQLEILRHALENNEATQEVFSVSVSADGSHFASGGELS